MIWGAMSSAGVGPLCFLKTNVTAPIYQEMLEHCMLPSADQLFKDADFIFQQDSAPAHIAKRTKSWLNDHGVGVLDWPANSPDLNPIEILWGIVKKKMRNDVMRLARSCFLSPPEVIITYPPWLLYPNSTHLCTYSHTQLLPILMAYLNTTLPACIIDCFCSVFGRCLPFCLLN